MEQLNLRALGRGEALPESLPDLLFQESVGDKENQFTRMIRSLPELDRADGGSDDLSELLLNEGPRISAVKGKFAAQFNVELREDYQFNTYDEVVAAT